MTLNSLTDQRNRADARQNATTAYNLLHSGVYSSHDGRTREVRPTLRREPLPPTVYALYMAIHPAFQLGFDLDEILNGSLTQTVKQANLFFTFVMGMSVFWIFAQLFRPRLVAIVLGGASVLLIQLLYSGLGRISDRLMTELPASAGLCLSVALLLYFLKNRTVPTAILFGISLGLLALTKAAFLYVMVAFLPVLFLIDYRENRRSQVLQSARLLMLYVTLVGATAATVLPWMTRNFVVADNFTIAQRGGDVLALRALIIEYPLGGALYVYSPTRLRPIAGFMTGYDEADLNDVTSIGALNRELEGNIAKRRWDIYRERMAAAGYEYRGMGASEAWLTTQALNYFASNPGRYLLSIPTFYYRAMWGNFTVSRHFGFGTVITMHLALLLSALWAAATGRTKLFAVVGLSAAWLVFHAMFTHNIPRYSQPVSPMLIVSSIVLIGWLGEVIARRMRRSASSE